MDKSSRDVAEQYEAWASAQPGPTRTTTPDAQTYALRVMEDACDQLEEQNVLLRHELAKAARDYDRLLARTSKERRERRERASWRDAPLAVLATAWDALTRRWWALETSTREDVTLALCVLLGGLVAALIVGRP